MQDKKMQAAIKAAERLTKALNDLGDSGRLVLVSHKQLPSILQPGKVEMHRHEIKLIQA